MRKQSSGWQTLPSSPGLWSVNAEFGDIPRGLRSALAEVLQDMFGKFAQSNAKLLAYENWTLNEDDELQLCPYLFNAFMESSDKVVAFGEDKNKLHNGRNRRIDLWVGSHRRMNQQSHRFVLAIEVKKRNAKVKRTEDKWICTRFDYGAQHWETGWRAVRDKTPVPRFFKREWCAAAGFRAVFMGITIELDVPRTRLSDGDYHDLIKAVTRRPNKDTPLKPEPNWFGIWEPDNAVVGTRLNNLFCLVGHISLVYEP